MKMAGAGSKCCVAVLVALLPIGGTALAGGLGPSEGEMRVAIEQLMIEGLRDVLRLTPHQEAQVIPQVKALLEARKDHLAQRRAARARLRALLMDDGASEKAIAGAIEEARGIERGFRLKEEGLRDAIDSDLTPRQRGRFMLFEDRFRRVMQRRLREAAERRAERPPDAPGGRPAGASEDIAPDDPGPQEEDLE